VGGRRGLLSLAAGYADPLITSRGLLGSAGRRRSLEERRDIAATPFAHVSREVSFVTSALKSSRDSKEGRPCGRPSQFRFALREA